jgi:hypothetical protein
MPSETPQYTLNLREYSSAQKGANIPWNMRLIWPRPKSISAKNVQWKVVKPSHRSTDNSPENTQSFSVFRMGFFG